MIKHIWKHLTKVVVILAMLLTISVINVDYVNASDTPNRTKDELYEFYKPQDSNCISTTFQDNYYKHGAIVSIDLYVVQDTEFDFYYVEYSGDEGYCQECCVLSLSL